MITIDIIDLIAFSFSFESPVVTPFGPNMKLQIITSIMRNMIQFVSCFYVSGVFTVSFSLRRCFYLDLLPWAHSCLLTAALINSVNSSEIDCFGSILLKSRCTYSQSCVPACDDHIRISPLTDTIKIQELNKLYATAFGTTWSLFAHRDYFYTQTSLFETLGIYFIYICCILHTTQMKEKAN